MRKGFTLIELLVVIAIIGLLSSVVLASLNTARGKGSDAAIKSALNNARAQSELFYDTGLTYDGVCASAGGSTIGLIIANAASKLATGAPVGLDAQALVIGTTGAAGNAICHDAAGGWLAAVSLKGVTGSYWCVDSTGKSQQSSAAIAANTVICP